LATALFLGVALSISSIKIVAMVVHEINFMRRDLGQIIVASAIIDDSIGWIIIAVVFGVARGGSFQIGQVVQSVAGVAAHDAAGRRGARESSPTTNSSPKRLGIHILKSKLYRLRRCSLSLIAGMSLRGCFVRDSRRAQMTFLPYLHRAMKTQLDAKSGLRPRPVS
jgi:hypothetical protein